MGVGMTKQPKYEMFYDECRFHVWTVRPIGDRRFNSPNLVHFVHKKEAEEYLKMKNEEADNAT